MDDEKLIALVQERPSCNRVTTLASWRDVWPPNFLFGLRPNFVLYLVSNGKILKFYRNYLFSCYIFQVSERSECGYNKLEFGDSKKDKFYGGIPLEATVL